MKRLGLAFALSVLLLPVAADADEFYTMNKLSFCGNADAGSVTISATAFSEDASRVAVATEGLLVRICDTASGNEIALLSAATALDQPDGLLGFVAFSADGARLATASGDRIVRFWDIASGRQLGELAHPSPVVAVALSPKGAGVATASAEGMVRLWDSTSGSAIASLQPSLDVTSLSFSPDGKQLAATGRKGKVHLWDAASGKKIATLEGHAGKVLQARYSSDGGKIVTASDDRTARIWNAADGGQLLVLPHASEVHSAAFSKDGTRIVTASANEAHMFDAVSGGEIHVLRGHEGDVNDTAFSHDGLRVATAAEDRSIRVWDVESGAGIAVLTGHLNAPGSVAFSPDGQRLLSTSGVEPIAWTRMPAGGFPDGFSGIWFSKFDGMDDSAEFARSMCLMSPIKIHGNGLIVLFDGMGQDPPQTILHLRCASDRSCQMFGGAPGQSLDAQGRGNLDISGDDGKLCIAGECRPIVRCPALIWNDEERKSGFAERWEAAVNAQGQ